MDPRFTSTKFNCSSVDGFVPFGELDHNAFKALEVDDLEEELLEDELGM